MANSPQSNPKRVCVLLQGHYDSDIRVRRKAEALVGAGYEVDVLALRDERKPLEEYDLNGVHVYTVSLGKKRGSLFRYIYEYVAFLLWARRTLNELLPRRRYAVVDVNNLPDFLVFATGRAKKRGATVVLDMHEITPEFFMSKYGVGAGHPLVRFTRWLERASVRRTDHVITINDPLRDVLIGRGLRRAESTIIMNSVDEALFEAALRQPAAGAHAALPQPSFLMMYHGTLTNIYGLDIAIRAFARAQAAMPGAEFWILGGGPEKEALIALARELGVGDRVRLLGSVKPDEIPHLLKRCDIGVLPTRQDVFLDLSFSNKLSEYIIMGKAVICSRLRTIRHYFSDEALAFFQAHDPEALAQQMTRLYADAELRGRLATRAREEYRSINWAVMKRRYLELMDALAARGARAAGAVEERAVGASEPETINA
jgi:glycosyltransferase involved in cell wall biosynthesis